MKTTPDSSPILVVYPLPASLGGLQVMLDTSACQNPEDWAPLIAEMVQHVLNAYDIPQGQQLALRKRIRARVITEWDQPTRVVLSSSSTPE